MYIDILISLSLSHTLPICLSRPPWDRWQIDIVYNKKAEKRTENWLENQRNQARAEGRAS